MAQRWTASSAWEPALPLVFASDISASRDWRWVHIFFVLISSDDSVDGDGDGDDDGDDDGVYGDDGEEAVGPD